LNLNIGYNDEVISEYDKNGNILKLHRNYNDTNIDSLIYHYLNNSNLLDSIVDLGVIDDQVGYPGSSAAYDYDFNGNMKFDGSKDFKIEYDSILNLPKKIVYDNDNRIFLHYRGDVNCKCRVNVVFL
jgi:hypothetical protein